MNSGGTSEEFSPKPLPGNALIYYYLAGAPAEPVKLDILDARDAVVRSFTSDSALAAKDGESPIPAETGMNRVTWNVTYRGPKPVEGTVLWGYGGGVKAPPGTYQARLTVDGQAQVRSFEVLNDPRLSDVTQADYEEQFRLASAIRDTLNHIYDAIRTARSVRVQVTTTAERAREAGYGEELKSGADSIAADLTEVEEDLTQTRNKSDQDPIRFPPMLDNQFVSLYEYVTSVDEYRYGGAEGRPTGGAYELFGALNTRWSEIRARLDRILNADVARFNADLERLGVPAILVPAGGVTGRLVP